MATVRNDAGGSSSYVKIEGPLAATFFGSDPAESQGKDPDFFSGLSDLSVLQYEIAKWPEDLRNQARPVYEAVGDISAAWDSIQNVVKGLMSIVLGTSTSTKLGLIGGDGVTIGANGPIYTAGNSITFVAGKGDEADKNKFIPGIEWAVNELLHLGDEAGKALRDQFKPKGKPDGLSGFRVVSNQDIHLAATRLATLTSLGAVALQGLSLEAVSRDATLIASRTGAVTIRGASIAVGGQAARGKQQATTHVTVNPSDRIDLITTNLRASLNGDAIQLGLRDAATFDLDDSKPRVVVSLAAGAEEVKVGLNNGSECGLQVDHAGDVTLSAASKLVAGINGAGITVQGGKVAVAGNLEVGTALTVRGDGTLSLGAKAAAAVATELTQLKADVKARYAAKLVEAKGKKAEVKLKEQALTLAKGLAKQQLNPMARVNAKKTLRKQKKALRKARDELAAMKVEKDAIVAEAATYGFSDDDIGRGPNDDREFVLP